MNGTFQLPSALEICEKFPCKPEVWALAAEYPKALDFISALRQEKMSLDAVQALARCLPKDKAVAWASQSARMAGEKTGLSPEEENALEATEAWIEQPNAVSREEVASAAADLPADSPACWASNAAAFSEGVEMPEDASMPETGDDLTIHFSASSVLLSAAKMPPEGIPEVSEVLEPFIELGIKLVQTVPGWL
jgi:hypothetical protein